MDISPIGLARSCLPHLPVVLRTAILSALRFSPKNEYQGLLTQVIVEFARPILQSPCALLKSQIQFNRDFGVWGRIWVSKYTIPTVQHSSCHSLDNSVVSIGDAVALAIKQLGNGDDNQHTLHIPAQAELETEWVGNRSQAWLVSPRPRGYTERQMFDLLMEEVDPDGPTILYFHGGAFCLMDPATERHANAALARATKGRLLAVRYRLAPQNPFPAALIDALTAYLALISPPPNAYHKPVPPSKIIIAGDSSGAGLAASLQLLLLTLSRQGTLISWHGQNQSKPEATNDTISIPSPPNAGLTIISPWLDVSRSLPSTTLNAHKWDIIAPPPLDAASPPFPPDSIWPTSPPRAETYCTASMVTHPLVSPLAAQSIHWKGCPPTYVCVGWEGMTDEAEVFARRVYSSCSNDDSHGPVVVFDGYMGMPHCFSMFPWNEAGQIAQQNTAKFCVQAVHHAAKISQYPKSSSEGEDDLLSPRPRFATWTRSVDPRGPVERVKIDKLGMTQTGCGYERKQPLTDEFVEESMTRSRLWRVKLEEEMIRTWKEGREVAQLGV